MTELSEERYGFSCLCSMVTDPGTLLGVASKVVVTVWASWAGATP